MSINTCSNALRSTLLCIDSYESRVMRGRLCNACCNDGITFESTMDFLSKMEALLEKMKLPQAFSERRTFRKNAECPSASASAGSSVKGDLATFTLRVLFRQNASWQGSIYWHEGEQSECFRSVLELLMLIDSAVA